MYKQFVHSYMYLFLCSIAVVRCEDRDNQQIIKNKIERFVIILNTNSNDKYYQKSMFIKNIDGEVDTNPYEIFIYNDPFVDKAYALYTVINCKFALWVEQEIYRFINNISGLRQDKIAYYNGLYEENYEHTFRDKLNIFINNISHNVLRFINILTYFIEIISDSSYYMDFGVLKSLISLHIKIDLMSFNNDDNQRNLKKLSSEIIKLLLIETTELQRFLSLNCVGNIVSNDTKISNLFGLWEFIAVETNNNEFIDQFLTKILHIGLESDKSLNNCSTRQIFLENIIKIPENDLISFIVYKTKVEDHSNDNTVINSVLIEDIKGRLEISYDIDIIGWYHDSILIAIMKIVYMFVMYSEQYIKETISKIKVINKKIQDNQNVLPAYFIKGFSILNNIDDSKQSQRENIKLYFIDDLRNISYADFTFSLDFNNFPKYLEQIITRLLNNFDDIICAQNYLKNVRKVNGKYYTPGSQNKNSLLINYTDIDEAKHKYYSACRFVSYVYKYSFRAQDFIDDFDFRVKSKLSKSACKVIRNVFHTISNCCQIVFKYEDANFNFIKMTYDIATLLKNQRFDSNFEKKNLFLFERILNIVMNELNVYRIKYCSHMIDSEYLLVNNIYSVDKMGQNILFQDFIKHFFAIRYRVSRTFKTFKPLNFDQIIDSKNAKYFQINYLYKKFIKKSLVIKLYGDSIKIYWNRRQRSIKNIFLDLGKVILNPQNMYVLYDIYNKFYLSVIFFEVYNFGKDYNTSKKGLEEMIKELKYDDCYKIFPETMTSFKSDLKTIFHFSDIEDRYEALNVLRQKKLQIEKKFKKSNFVITYNLDRLSLPFLTSIKENNIIKLLHKEIVTNVKKFNKTFYKLYRFDV